MKNFLQSGSFKCLQIQTYYGLQCRIWPILPGFLKVFHNLDKFLPKFLNLTFPRFISLFPVFPCYFPYFPALVYKFKYYFPNKTRTNWVENQNYQKGTKITGVGPCYFRPSNSLFPVGFAVDADIDIGVFADTLTREITNHSVGVFYGHASWTVDDELNKTRVFV